MEVVEGQSLETLIPAGGFSLQKFDLALSLTDASGAGHVKGITHRDLKPPSIMVPDDGRVNPPDCRKEKG